MKIVIFCILYFLIFRFTPIIFLTLFNKIFKYDPYDIRLDISEQEEKETRYKILLEIIKQVYKNWNTTFFIFVPVYFVLLLFPKILIVNKILWWLWVVITVLDILPIITLFLYFPVDCFMFIFKYRERMKGIGYCVLGELLRFIDFGIDIIVLANSYVLTFMRV